MHHRRKHTRRIRKYKMRGGSKMFGNSYETVSNAGGSSGWKYMSDLVGDTNQQYKNTLMGNGSGNTLNVRSSTMSGGRRRRNRSRRHRRGGSFGPVVADAIVPLGLLAAQQSYGRKLRKSRRRH
jgi:hypothetical protein